MRGIGTGQKIRVYIIPEVKQLMQRELKDAVIVGEDHVLEDIIAWLVINSLRSEQTQWTMLCLQNIGNFYRKNAFECLHEDSKRLIAEKVERTLLRRLPLKPSQQALTRSLSNASTSKEP